MILAKRAIFICLFAQASIVAAANQNTEFTSETFNINEPFPTIESINSLRVCYPNIPVDQASRLLHLQRLFYLERKANPAEAASSTCGSRQWQTYISNRQVEVRLPDLSAAAIDRELSPQKKDECEEQKSFDKTGLLSISKSGVVYKANARYKTRSCHWLTGKNDKYSWRGALVFKFPLEELHVDRSASPESSTVKEFKGHRFLPPQVSIETYSEDTNYFAALVDPKTLLGVLVGGLIGGPGGAVLLGSIGAGVAVSELAAIGDARPRLESAARSEVDTIIKKLVSDDVMRSLSRAVDRTTREIEFLQPAYTLEPLETGFVAGTKSEVAYQFSDVGSYCSVQLQGMLKGRRQTQDLIQSFQNCHPRAVTVSRGGSLWKIAKAHLDDGHAYLFIAALNDLKPNQPLRPGSVVMIPSRCDLCAKRNEGILVTRGATLAKMIGHDGVVPAAQRKRLKTLSGDPDLIYPYEVISRPK